MRNIHRRFVLCSNGHIYGGDFAKFCGLLRINKLYITQRWLNVERCFQFQPIFEKWTKLWLTNINACIYTKILNTDFDHLFGRLDEIEKTFWDWTHFTKSSFINHSIGKGNLIWFFIIFGSNKYSFCLGTIQAWIYYEVFLG